MSERKLFTSESVSEGHPDKIADQISDAILDAILAKDPEAHVAAETAVYTGSVHVFGEISTNAYVDINRGFVIPLQRLAIPIPNMDFLLRQWESIRHLLSSHPILPKVLTKLWRFVGMQTKIHLT